MRFEGKSVLEIGTGTGIIGAYAARLGATRLVATDISEAAIENAERNDPAAGFALGGGRFGTPPGALGADSGFAGRVDFGFFAKYRKGADVPMGRAVLRFRDSGLRFALDAYEWLVIDGPRAELYGRGRIEGRGELALLLTVVDGRRRHPREPDRIRVRVFESATGALVYDTEPGLAAGSEPTLIPSSGSILVHLSGAAAGTARPDHSREDPPAALLTKTRAAGDLGTRRAASESRGNGLGFSSRAW